MAQHTGGIGNVTPNAQLIEMAMAYSRSRILCAAARLGIADALGDDERSAGFLADACGADPDALYRLLRTLAALGVTAEWSMLTDCVRAGKPASQLRNPNLPSRWSQEPEADAIFRAVMGTAPAEDYAPIARAWDFSRARTVADLGGGGGSLIIAVLKLGPALRGMLVDFERSILAAQSRFMDEDLSSRCELIAADLFQSVPTGADVYMLKHVLHGCQDEDAVTILKNCRAVIPHDGRLLVIEFVLPPLVAQTEPQLAGRLMSDLTMLVVTGGRERTEREWKVLLEAAGFTLRHLRSVYDDGGAAQSISILEAEPL